MRTAKIIISVSVVGLMIVLGAATYASQGQLYGWIKFYLWKLTEGKAHGGRHAKINDVTIYYETYGDGPPVLVLHGGLGSIESLSNQIEALAKSHFVIAADSRGHGRSTDSNTPLSYSLMSDDMSKLLDHLQIDSADVVGWSDGAIIGLDLAMHHPDRVKKLVAISANYDVDGVVESVLSGSTIPRAPLSYRLFARDSNHWPALYREVMTMWKTQPHYTLRDIGQIRCPTLIMTGEFDIIKREHSAQLAKAILGSEEVIIPGAKHTSPIDKPEIVNSNVLRFLEEQPGSGSK
jgi:pimeloyl-ACP methyl ester carboxylesterase